MPERPPKAVTATQKKVAAICDKAIEEIQQKVLAHYQKHPDSAWSGHYLVDLEKTIKAVYQSMGIDIGRSFRDGLTANMQAMYDKAVEDLKTSGKRNAILGKPNERLIKNYMESSFDEIAMRTQKMSFDHVRSLRSMAADVLRTSSLTGASRAEVTKQFLARAQEIPGFKFTAANGAQWTNKAYFTMLARTELMQAGRAAYDQKCADEGCDVVELDYSGNCCDACARWEGKQFSLTGATKGLPTKADLEADGVFHPNCTHRYSAVANWDAVREAAEEAKKEDEEEEAKRREEEQAAQQSPAKPEETAPAQRRQADNGPARSSSPQASDKAMKAAEDKARRDTEAQAREMAAQSAEQQAEAAKQQAEEKRKAQADAAKLQREVEAEARKAEHIKHREEQREKALENRREKARKAYQQAVDEGLNKPDFIADVRRTAGEEAGRKGLTGPERDKYIDEKSKETVRKKTGLFRRIADIFADKYDSTVAKFTRPPAIVFDDKADTSGVSRDFKEIHVKTTGDDAEWLQNPRNADHEMGHVIHGTARRIVKDLQPALDGSAIADWQRIYDDYNGRGELDMLKGLNSVPMLAKKVFNKDVDQLSEDDLASLGQITDTIGSIANGGDFGWGHEPDYYDRQYHSVDSYSEAFGNVWALYYAIPHDILSQLFPNLFRIIDNLHKL